jgi:hypothetical protein
MPMIMIKRMISMLKRPVFLLITLLSLFIMTGCVERGVPVLPGEKSYPGGWGANNDEENIDISDIDQNITESGTDLSGESQKVARIPFPIKEYARLPRSGKGTIKGKIYLSDGYELKIPGKDTRLYLNPKTSYSDQWYEESYIGGRKMQKADDRLFNYLRFTSSDANGNFAFYGVPSGTYYLIGTVKCGSECGYERPKNIRIATQVRVVGNQILTKDLVGRPY